MDEMRLKLPRKLLYHLQLTDKQSRSKHFESFSHFIAVFFHRKNIIICGALRDLVPFVQFKKREKHPWRSVLACNFTKGNTPP